MDTDDPQLLAIRRIARPWNEKDTSDGDFMRAYAAAQELPWGYSVVIESVCYEHRWNNGSRVTTQPMVRLEMRAAWRAHDYADVSTARLATVERSPERAIKLLKKVWGGAPSALLPDRPLPRPTEDERVITLR